MRRLAVLPVIALLVTLAFGASALGSAGASAATEPGHPNKAAFCAANNSIDKASANVSSSAGFLAVLKSHTAQLRTLKDDAPAGAVGTLVQQVIAAADAALASNNPNDLNNAPEGGGIDTYCGVNGVGKPLPKYFATGKGTSFCSTFLPIFQAVGSATSKAGAVAALVADKTQVSQLGSELSGLPKSIKAKATATVDTAQTAITTNSAAGLGLGGNGPASSVALYCGQNQ